MCVTQWQPEKCYLGVSSNRHKLDRHIQWCFSVTSHTKWACRVALNMQVASCAIGCLPTSWQPPPLHTHKGTVAIYNFRLQCTMYGLHFMYLFTRMPFSQNKVEEMTPLAKLLILEWFLHLTKTFVIEMSYCVHLSTCYALCVHLRIST